MAYNSLLKVHYLNTNQPNTDRFMNTSQSPIMFGIQCLVMSAERNGKHIKQLNFTPDAWESMVNVNTTHDFQDGFDKTCFGYPVNITNDIQDGVFEINYFPKKTLN